MTDQVPTNTFKWDSRFLELAQSISDWSKDPSTLVGAIIVDKNKRIISIGYNGLPQKIKDSPERLNNRELKLKCVIHAEINALLFANCKIDGCTLYTYPFMPCGPCCSMFIQSGISRIVSINNYNERWAKDFEITTELCKEAGVELTLY